MMKISGWWHISCPLSLDIQNFGGVSCSNHSSRYCSFWLLQHSPAADLAIRTIEHRRASAEPQIQREAMRIWKLQ